MTYKVSVDGDVFEIELGPGGRAWVNQQPYEVDLRDVRGNGSTQGAGEYSLLVDHRSYEVHVADSDDGERWLTIGGRPYRARLRRAPDGGCRPDGRGRGRARGGAEGCGDLDGPVAHAEMRAPLPGLLVELRVREGEYVEERQVVAVLESMKMNLEIRAPRGGVVRDLCVVPGRQVAQDEVLAVLGPNGARNG
jgi:biotin carboxyl carrier protein